MRRSGRVRRAILAGPVLMLAATLAACAKRGPPTGGPPDIEPPRLIASSPDSGAAGVARDAVMTLTFSEGMDPRSSSDAISIAPRIDIKQRRWSNRTVAIVPAETLRAPPPRNSVYVWFARSVSAAARATATATPSRAGRRSRSRPRPRCRRGCSTASSWRAGSR